VIRPASSVADAAFSWHPASRLFDGQGREQRPVERDVAVIADRPSTLALATALATPGFRIGPEGPPPHPSPEPMFETLTSGSTGAPRRIRRSQASWTASFAVNAGLFGIGPGARVAVLGRLAHSLSLYGAMEGMHLGADVYLLDDLRPDRQRKALAKQQISHLYATPSQLRLIVDAGGPTCPALRVVLVGGSKLDIDLRRDMQKITPFALVHEFYGAAETSFIALSDAQTPTGSVGRAYPGVEIALIDGAIWVRSPYVFAGYAADSGDAHWQDGWLSVGDMGRMSDGYLYLSGRAGRMVTVADQNVFPEEIEAFMERLPGIRRVAVLPVTDALRGAVLVAAVQGDPEQEERILSALRIELGSLKAPKSLIWITDWPVVASGKTDFATLQRGLRWPI
jgi:long-chain acyl-CoA synthetase